MKAPREREETPWGPAQHVKEVAPGIVAISTAGHGGYWLSPERMKEFNKVLPGVHPWLGNGGEAGLWLEEDCDWALAVLVWPALFKPDDRYNAYRSVQHRKDDKDAIDAFLASPRGREFAKEATEAMTARHGQWEVGTSVYGSEPYVIVHLRQVGTMIERRAAFKRGHPRQQFYTEEELQEALYRPEPASV